ncbi:zinc ribbon domain-containing protein [Leptothoe sp. EHU-05/26/07-4]
MLIKDHHPAYISWEQYQRNLSQLKSNRSHASERGSARPGKALLSGLVVCQKCEIRMGVGYHRPHAHNYVCRSRVSGRGEPICQFLSGSCLDEYVTQQVLAALQPASLELSLSVATHVEQDRRELDKLWQQRLERATFETERAGRHYQCKITLTSAGDSQSTSGSWPLLILVAKYSLTYAWTLIKNSVGWSDINAIRGFVRCHCNHKSNIRYLKKPLKSPMQFFKKVPSASP